MNKNKTQEKNWPKISRQKRRKICKTNIKEKYKLQLSKSSEYSQTNKQTPSKKYLSPNYLLFCSPKEPIFNNGKPLRFDSIEIEKMLDEIDNFEKSESKNKSEKKQSQTKMENSIGIAKNNVDLPEKVISSSKEEDSSKDSPKVNRKKKAIPSRASQNKNNRKACNCMRCEECKKRLQKIYDDINSDDNDE